MNATWLRSIKAFCILIAIVELGAPAIANAQPANQRQAPIAGVPKGWLNGMRKRAASYVEFAAASFTLDEGQRGILRIELDNRISDQWATERELADNPPPDPKDDSQAEIQRFAQAINAAYEKMPMNPNRVVEWIVDTIAAPEEAIEGKMRFLELCERLDLENKSTVKTSENKVKLSRLFKSARARELQFNRDGVLVPAWQVKHTQVPRGYEVRPSVKRGGDRMNRTSIRDDLPPPLPCLVQAELWADWVAKNGQTANADAFRLFQEFQFKTWWVLAGDNDVYKLVSRADRNSIVEKAIEDAGLRPQIDALVHELRCRVEAAGLN